MFLTVKKSPVNVQDKEKQEIEEERKRLFLLEQQKQRRTEEIYMSLKEIREKQLQEVEQELTVRTWFECFSSLDYI